MAGHYCDGILEWARGRGSWHESGRTDSVDALSLEGTYQEIRMLMTGSADAISWLEPFYLQHFYC
ncbi:hypothetical protein D3C71_2091190 [compost metagenome]